MLSNLQLFLLALVLSIFNWLMTFLGSSLVYFVKSKSQKLVSIASVSYTHLPQASPGSLSDSVKKA